MTSVGDSKDVACVQECVQVACPKSFNQEQALSIAVIREEGTDILCAEVQCIIISCSCIGLVGWLDTPSADDVHLKIQFYPHQLEF